MERIQLPLSSNMTILTSAAVRLTLGEVLSLSAAIGIGSIQSVMAGALGGKNRRWLAGFPDYCVHS